MRSCALSGRTPTLCQRYFLQLFPGLGEIPGLRKEGMMSGGEMKKCLSLLFVFAVALLCAPSGWAQAQITTGAVQGDVLDEKGGSVPDAKVDARNLDTNYLRTESTNNDGHYAFLSLAPGRYTLTITKQGFAT